MICCNFQENMNENSNLKRIINYSKDPIPLENKLMNTNLCIFTSFSINPNSLSIVTEQ